MLSNTATPKYYGKFRDLVLAGAIPVNKEISMEMNRIDDLIRSPNIFYDENAVEGWIDFCNSELTLTDGTDLNLLDSFKLWGEEVFGWYYFVERSVFVHNQYGDGHYIKRKIKKRLINKQYLIVGRGAAKTMYAEAIQAYGLIVDTSTTYQVTVAPTMKQADEVLSPIRTAMSRARGPLVKFMTDGSLRNTTGSPANRVKLASTKKGIENFLTNSLLDIRPMSIDKLQGLRARYATVDEWLSCDINEDVVGTIEQGAIKNTDYLIICTSSEGTVRSGVGDTIKMELMDILKGKYPNPHVSIFYYRLDDVKEVGDPNTWVKANPNIGITVSYEDYQEAVTRAENSPSTKNDILAKLFGIPCEGYTYYFTYEETLPFSRQEYWQMSCAMGADLSQGGDFCSFLFLFPLQNSHFGVKTVNYITELTLNKLPTAMRAKYQEFINEGSLIIMPGVILDMDIVYEDLDKLISDRNYEVCALGYDPYNAKTFIDRWTQENGEFGVEKVIQGAKTETVPLKDIKTLTSERMLIFDESMMSYTMGNAIVLVDTNGNMKLMKRKYEDKIDSVAALMDAFVAYTHNKDAFD